MTEGVSFTDMKIDFSQSITFLDGTPFKGTSSDGTSFSFETLKEVAVHALTTVGQNDNTSGVKKFERGLLAMKIYAATEPVEFATATGTQEIAELKELIGKTFSPLIVAQAWSIIEGCKVTPP